MAEDRINIQSGELKIECLVDNSPGNKAVVVTHPHPLYGGNMYSNVVEAMAEAYKQKGYTTLRFNFRGVGLSEGTHEQGIGEQNDVMAALVYLHDLGKTSIDLAGYSFGAWVCALGLKSFFHAERLIMVSPPVNFIDFSCLDYNPKIRLVIAGSEDDIAAPAKIKDMIPKWNPAADFKIIQGADHFYWENSHEIATIIQNFLDMEG